MRLWHDRSPSIPYSRYSEVIFESFKMKVLFDGAHVLAEEEALLA